MIYRKWSLITGPAVLVGGVAGAALALNFIFKQVSNRKSLLLSNDYFKPLIFIPIIACRWFLKICGIWITLICSDFTWFQFEISIRNVVDSFYLKPRFFDADRFRDIVIVNFSLWWKSMIILSFTLGFGSEMN